MLVVMTVIAVGLLSLSTISIKSVGLSSAKERAQANARMALMMAIDRLQIEMGPDQRISANADILSRNSNVANPHWLGVWDSWVAGPRGSAPVNPNYSSAFDSAHQTIGAQSGPLMKPTYAQKNRHFRGWLLSLNDEDTTNIFAAGGLNLEGVKLPGNDDTAVLLVSDGTLGSPSASRDQVSARLIEIEQNGSSVVGGGRGAWWVGDQSQKATLMHDSYVANPPNSVAERIFRTNAPGSMGNTSVTGFDGIADESDMARVASNKSLELLEGVGEANAKPRFHDVATSSNMVLTDVREGGLKRDLSTLLERNIDPNEVYDFAYVEEFQRAYGYKEDANDFMLYNFDSSLQSISPTGMANVPIQDLAAYYQLYDHSRSGWRGGIQFSSRDSSPANSLLDTGVMVSTPHLGYTTDYSSFLREYTYQYRRPVLVKHEMVIHFLAQPRDFEFEITSWLNQRVRIGGRNQSRSAHGFTRADAEVALNIPEDTHNLKMGLSPSMTYWNPYNVPLVMSKWDTFPSSPGTGRYPQQDKSSINWIESAMPVNLVFKKGTSRTDPNPEENSRSLGGVFDSGYQPYFYVNGNYTLTFEPGETKVLSLQATSEADPASALSEINFQNRGGGGGSDNEHFLPRLELVPGWNPDRFVQSTDQAGQTWNGNSVRPVHTFNANDYISVDIEYSGGTGFGFSARQTFRQARRPNAKYHHKLFTWQPRAGASRQFVSELVHLGFPRSGRGSLASTRPRLIRVPAKSGQELIDAIPADPSDLSSYVPHAFFYTAKKHASETQEQRNRFPAYGGSGRRFPARPFLHSPAGLPVMFDSVAGESLYDHGWSWYFQPLRNHLDAPVSISGNDSGYFGGGYTRENGVTHVVQQQVPIVPPMAIADLSHARLGGFSLATEATHSMGRWPFPDHRRNNIEGYRRVTAVGYGGLAPNMLQAIGNSYAHPNIPAGSALAMRSREYEEGAPRRAPFVDHSYLANKALWDDFFFSSITPIPDNPIYGSSPRTAAEVAEEFFFNGGTIPNRRMLGYKANLDQEGLDYLLDQYGDFNDGFADKIAAHLMVKGGFNINSTSEEAWKALFSSLKGKPVAYLDKDDALDGVTDLQQVTPTGVPISAGSISNEGTYSGSSSDPSDEEQWTGWRELTDGEIDELAKAMVRQVKARGPFLSLSEFVNRRLDSSDPELSVKGALQAALDDPDIPTSSAINGGFRSRDRIFSSAETRFVNAEFPEALEGPIAYGSTAYVDQADILRNLAAQLAPRGDTFVVRAYGDSLDARGNVEARAWCEAVVQRLPEYVDGDATSGDEPHVKYADLSSEANRRFGRKMQIVSFRWLNATEI